MWLAACISLTPLQMDTYTHTHTHMELDYVKWTLNLCQYQNVLSTTVSCRCQITFMLIIQVAMFIFSACLLDHQQFSEHRTCSSAFKTLVTSKIYVFFYYLAPTCFGTVTIFRDLTQKFLEFSFTWINDLKILNIENFFL